ncbi:MAG: hypothetical protein AAB956_01625, partial [Patescibacteria group bacterium]
TLTIDNTFVSAQVNANHAAVITSLKLPLAISSNLSFSLKSVVNFGDTIALTPAPANPATVTTSLKFTINTVSYGSSPGTILISIAHETVNSVAVNHISANPVVVTTSLKLPIAALVNNIS